MITKYDVFESLEDRMVGYSIGAYCVEGGFFLPIRFPRTPIGKIEAEQLIFNLTEWYGLPVDEKTIMSHFINQST